MTRPSAITIFAAITLLGLARPVFAQERETSLQQALRRADVIAEAEIVEVRARWRGGLIVSTVSARIRTCHSRTCPDELLSYETLGGEIDGVVQVVSGSSVPRVGQAMMLFLEHDRERVRLLPEAIGIRPITVDERGLPAVRFEGRLIPTADLSRLAEETH